MAENHKDPSTQAPSSPAEKEGARKTSSRNRSRGQQRRSQRSVFQYITVLFDALQEAEASEATVAKQERALQAMDWFWRIQRQFSRGYTRAARELAEQFEASGLVADLPDVSYAEPDGPSPKQQYAELYDLLF